MQPCETFLKSGIVTKSIVLALAACRLSGSIAFETSFRIANAGQIHGKTFSCLVAKSNQLYHRCLMQSPLHLSICVTMLSNHSRVSATSIVVPLGITRPQRAIETFTSPFDNIICCI